MFGIGDTESAVCYLYEKIVYCCCLFALIGTVIKIVLDRSFPVMEEENEQK